MSITARIEDGIVTRIASTMEAVVLEDIGGMWRFSSRSIETVPPTVFHLMVEHGQIVCRKESHPPAKDNETRGPQGAD
jgi:hypothetical protein